MEIGTWAELIAAAGGLAAAGISVLALRSALAANRTAESTRFEAKAYADATNRREERRQRAEVASQLQAWWVMWGPNDAHQYGVLVTNAGAGATVFRNVRIETCGNDNVRSSRDDITFASLPPGSYLVPSNWRGAPRPWGELQSASAEVVYEPLVKALSHSVTRISFEDPTKTHWSWTPEDGLTSSATPER